VLNNPDCLRVSKNNSNAEAVIMAAPSRPTQKNTLKFLLGSGGTGFLGILANITSELPEKIIPIENRIHHKSIILPLNAEITIS